jgi:uncharacterized protein (UPF0332 family)
VTPTGAPYLDKARQSLEEARAVAVIGLSEAAGRAAYLAAYHSAQAFVIDQTGKIAKTHGGVRSEFSRLAKDDPRIDRAFPTFLAQAYNLKAVADYGVGDYASLSVAEAQEAIISAERFVDCVADLLGDA